MLMIKKLMIWSMIALLILPNCIVKAGTKAKYKVLSGKYFGTYDGVQGTVGLTLNIYKTDTNRIEARFTFYPLKRSRKIKHGEFLMKVDYSSNSNIYFTAYKWVRRPAGYGLINLRGKLKNGVLAGEVFTKRFADYCTGDIIGEFRLKR